MNVLQMLAVAVGSGDGLRYEPTEAPGHDFWVYRDGRRWIPVTATLLRDLCHPQIDAWLDGLDR